MVDASKRGDSSDRANVIFALVRYAAAACGRGVQRLRRRSYFPACYVKRPDKCAKKERKSLLQYRIRPIYFVNVTAMVQAIRISQARRTKGARQCDRLA
jgi:hypothetical protein